MADDGLTSSATGFEAALEAVLFAAGEPVAMKRLTEMLQVSEAVLRETGKNLSGFYRFEQRGIRLMDFGDQLQLCSAPEFAELIRRVLEERKPPPMSRAALEVLALAAYHQPITRAYIDKVRGVESGATVVKLCEKGLLAESGRLEVPGRPVLYRTTTGFLRAFGLGSLDELPGLEGEETPEGQITLEELPAEEADDQCKDGSPGCASPPS